MKADKRILSIEINRLSDSDPDTSYLTQEGFEDRCAEYHNGAFEFIGIRASASIRVGNFLQSITSGGLWGIESDSDKPYLKEIEDEQLSELRDIRHELGFSKRAISTAIKAM
jgi:hypothetical protein